MSPPYHHHTVRQIHHEHLHRDFTTTCIAISSAARLAMPHLAENKIAGHDRRMPIMRIDSQKQTIHLFLAEKQETKIGIACCILSRQRERHGIHSPCCRFRRWRSVWKVQWCSGLVGKLSTLAMPSDTSIGKIDTAFCLIHHRFRDVKNQMMK